MVAKKPMMEMTTRSSTKVKAGDERQALILTFAPAGARWAKVLDFVLTDNMLIFYKTRIF
jgi:hypothetical protein